LELCTEAGFYFFVPDFVTLPDEEAVREGVVGGADPREGVVDVCGGAALGELEFNFRRVSRTPNVTVSRLYREDGAFISAVSD